MAKALVGKRRRGHVVRREKTREAQAVERSKKVLLLRATRGGPHGLQLLRDMRRIKGPDESILFSRKNEDVRPFDAEARLEMYCDKNDTGMFLTVSHSKKRPNNVTIGRVYDNHVLDMVELHLAEYVSLEDMVKKGQEAKMMGSQSAVLFQGDEFESSLVMQTVKSLLLDLFKAPLKEQVDIASLDHLVVCTACGGKVYIRNYLVVFRSKERKESGKNPAKEDHAAVVQVDGIKIPDVTLLDMGPSLDLEVRRSRLAASELMKLALKQPKAPGQVKKVKNISHDSLEGKKGRVHMERQDFTKLVTRSRFGNALKRSFKKDKNDNTSA